MVTRSNRFDNLGLRLFLCRFECLENCEEDDRQEEESGGVHKTDAGFDGVKIGIGVVDDHVEEHEYGSTEETDNSNAA